MSPFAKEPIRTESAVPFILTIADRPSRFGETVLMESRNAPIELRAYVLDGSKTRHTMRLEYPVTVVRSSRGASETEGSKRPVSLTLAFLGEATNEMEIVRALDFALPMLVRSFDDEEALWAFSQVAELLRAQTLRASLGVPDRREFELRHRLRHIELLLMMLVTVNVVLLILGVLSYLPK